jgi:hypothetical protein
MSSIIHSVYSNASLMLICLAEYMQYCYIVLYIDGDQLTLANLRAIITLEFAKGHKIANNKETEHHLSLLRDPHNSHICPIA